MITTINFPTLSAGWNCRQLELDAPDGKLRETDCSHTEGLLRIIQSIPPSRAVQTLIGANRLGVLGEN